MEAAWVSPPESLPAAAEPGPSPGAPARVLHVLPSLFGGGMERAAVRLICGGADSPGGSGGSSEIIHGMCLLGGGDEDLLAPCRSRGSTWVLGSRSKGAGLGGRFSWWRLARVIRHFRPHIVHARSTGTWFDAAVATLTHPQVRLVLSFHGRTHLSPPRWLRRRLNRWTTGRADVVLAVSREAAEMMRRQWGVADHKLRVIPNGVDGRRFRPAKDREERRQVRCQLQLPETDHAVMCVANLHPIKGLDVLLRAWRHVTMVDRDARLVLVGQGPLRRQLEQQADNLRCRPTVRFLGARNDVPQLLRAAELFVLPSRYEGCSNAVLEAMATGLAVVACDVGGMTELVTPNHTGWLVPPEAPGRLAETILAVLRDRVARERVGQAARAAAVKQFSIETWVSRYDALYRELAGRICPQPKVTVESLPCAG